MRSKKKKITAKKRKPAGTGLFIGRGRGEDLFEVGVSRGGKPPHFDSFLGMGYGNIAYTFCREEFERRTKLRGKLKVGRLYEIQFKEVKQKGRK